MSKIKHFFTALKSNSYFYWIIFFLAIIISLFLGYAAGRAYKTYEVKLAEASKQNTNSQSKPEAQTFAKELVNPNVYAPRITKLSATKDASGNYTLKIDTLHFRHTPENFGKPVEQNSGHANVFVNDKLITRATGPNVVLSTNLFTSGTNTISVSLHANNGNTWWSKKGTLEAKQTIEILK